MLLSPPPPPSVRSAGRPVLSPEEHGGQEAGRCRDADRRERLSEDRTLEGVRRGFRRWLSARMRTPADGLLRARGLVGKTLGSGGRTLQRILRTGARRPRQGIRLHGAARRLLRRFA